MISISKKSDYGLIFLTTLAQANSDQFIPLSQISTDKNLPYKFLSQIAIELKKSGLIESKEGLGGGYRLSHSPQKITVGKVLTVLDGPIAPTSCLRGKKCIHQSDCHHQVVMKNLSTVINTTLNGYTLADLISS